MEQQWNCTLKEFSHFYNWSNVEENVDEHISHSSKLLTRCRAGENEKKKLFFFPRHSRSNFHFSYKNHKNVIPFFLSLVQDDRTSTLNVVYTTVSVGWELSQEEVKMKASHMKNMRMRCDIYHCSIHHDEENENFSQFRKSSSHI